MAIELKVISESEQAKRDLKELNQAIGSIETGVNKASSSLSEFASNLAKTVISVGAVVSFVKLADSVTTFNTKLRVVTGSLTSFNQAFRNTQNIALNTRTSINTIGTLYQKLSMASEDLGASQREIGVVTQNVAKALATAGTEATQAQAAILQLSQALSSGVLAGDELRSILENAPNLARHIAKGLGTTVGQLRILGATGKLTSKEVFGAILSQTQDINTAFKEVKVTYEQAFTNIGNSFFLLFNSVQRVFSGSGGAIPDFINKVALGIARIARNLDFVLFKMQVKVVKFINYLADALTIVPNLVRQAFQELSDKFDFKIKFQKLNIADFIPGLGDVLKTVKNWAAKVEYWFFWLYDKVIGNSWIPDLVMGVIEWMNKLMVIPLRVAKMFALLVSDAFKAIGESDFSKGVINQFRKIEAWMQPFTNKIKKLARDFKDWFDYSEIGHTLKQITGQRDKIPYAYGRGRMSDPDANVGRGPLRNKSYFGRGGSLHDIVNALPMDAQVPAIGAVAAAAAGGLVLFMKSSPFRSILLQAVGFAFTGATALFVEKSQIIKSIIDTISLGIRMIFGSGIFGDAGFGGLLAKMASVALLFKGARSAAYAMAGSILSGPSRAAASSMMGLQANIAGRASQSITQRVATEQARAAANTRKAATALNNATADLNRMFGAGAAGAYVNANAMNQANARRNLLAANNTQAARNALSNFELARRQNTLLAANNAVLAQTHQSMTQNATRLQQLQERLRGEIAARREAFNAAALQVGSGVGGAVGAIGGLNIGNKIADSISGLSDWGKIGVQIGSTIVGQVLGAGVGAALAGAFVFALRGSTTLLSAPFLAIAGLMTDAIIGSFRVGSNMVQGLFTLFLRGFGGAGVLFGAAVTAALIGVVLMFKNPEIFSGLTDAWKKIQDKAISIRVELPVVIESIKKTINEVFGKRIFDEDVKGAEAQKKRVQGFLSDFDKRAALLKASSGSITPEINKLTESLATQRKAIESYDDERDGAFLKNKNVFQIFFEGVAVFAKATTTLMSSISEVFAAFLASFNEAIHGRFSSAIDVFKDMALVLKGNWRELDDFASKMLYGIPAATETDKNYVPSGPKVVPPPIYAKPDATARMNAGIFRPIDTSEEEMRKNRETLAKLSDTMDRLVNWLSNFSFSNLFSRKATGGAVFGPGTTTSDSIPALLSNGEFVVNAKSTARNRGLLEHINRYATGGLVTRLKKDAETIAPIEGDLQDLWKGYYLRYTDNDTYGRDANGALIGASHYIPSIQPPAKRRAFISKLKEQLDSLVRPHGVDIEYWSGNESGGLFVPFDDGSKPLYRGAPKILIPRIETAQSADSAYNVWLHEAGHVKDFISKGWSAKNPTFNPYPGVTGDGNIGLEIELQAIKYALTNSLFPISREMRRTSLGTTEHYLKMDRRASEASKKEAREIVAANDVAVTGYVKPNQRVEDSPIFASLMPERKKDNIATIVDQYLASFNPIESLENNISSGVNISAENTGDTAQPTAPPENDKPGFIGRLLTWLKTAVGVRDPSSIVGRFLTWAADHSRNLVSEAIKGAGFARGGRVWGSGSGTSDSIPAMLSNGEFVVNARATARNEALLSAINSGMDITGFAGGGKVGSEAEIAGWKKLIREYSEKHKVDPELVIAIIKTESAWNPNAVSDKGAVGLGQLMPDTASRFGLDPSDRNNPAKNLEASVKYLAELTKMFEGDQQKIAAAYHSGEGTVQGIMKKNNGTFDPTQLGPNGQEYLRKLNLWDSGSVLEKILKSLEGLGGRIQEAFGPTFEKVVNFMMPPFMAMMKKFGLISDTPASGEGESKSLMDRAASMFSGFSTPGDQAEELSVSNLVKYLGESDIIKFINDKLSGIKISMEQFQALTSEQRTLLLHSLDNADKLKETIAKTTSAFDRLQATSALKQENNTIKTLLAGPKVEAPLPKTFAEKFKSATNPEEAAKILNEYMTKFGILGNTIDPKLLADADPETVNKAIEIITNLEGLQGRANGSGFIDRMLNKPLYDQGKRLLQDTMSDFFIAAAKDVIKLTLEAGRVGAAALDSLQDTFRQGLGDLIKGRINGKAFGTALLDNLTNSIVDSMVKGLTDSLFKALRNVKIGEQDFLTFILGKGYDIASTIVGKIASVFSKKPTAVPKVEDPLAGISPSQQSPEDVIKDQRASSIDPVVTSSPDIKAGMEGLAGVLEGISTGIEDGFMGVVKVVQLVLQGIFSLITLTGSKDIKDSVSSLFSGFSGGFDKLIGGTSGSSGIMGMLGDAFISLFGAANGGVFMNGISGFSGNIVNTPTAFKFANGIGIMGEAGPEAIMPLKRGPDGKLGVRSEGSPSGNQATFNINITGDVSRQTRMEIQRMIPQIAGGVNAHNYEQGYKR